MVWAELVVPVGHQHHGPRRPDPATKEHQQIQGGLVGHLDALSGGAGTFLWRLETPGGAILFDGLYVDRSATLPETGAYELTVRGATATTTGTYSFRLLLTPPAEEFTIALGDTVSDGVPAPGAGNLEGPGAIDRYLFPADAGQVAILDALTGSTNEVRWRLQAPDGTQIFDSLYIDQQVTLTEPGIHTLTVSGLTVTSSGTYSFQLREAPVNQAPVAGDDQVETDHGTAVTIDVLANDFDPDGDDLAIAAVTPPAAGTATHHGNQITYTPGAGVRLLSGRAGNARPEAAVGHKLGSTQPAADRRGQRWLLTTG